MYDRLGTFELGSARLVALVMADEIVERLDHTCAIREEALFDLAVLGWSEEAFINEAYGRACDHE